LINKTNQFNLNGGRVSEGDWNRYLEDSRNVTMTVSYEDKFGPLGKIAVLVAENCAGRARVTHWVMSCRAFSRKIEHHVLDAAFRELDAHELEFDFKPTERNQPLQEFFRAIGVDRGVLTKDRFYAACGDLPHHVTIVSPEVSASTL
jgi:FkbH-like protein